ncbi:Protein phosphatase 1 regulatory subunit SDS22 [Golovinomyces cichoracearum]|uniref:Protein phosphatase 1 regulatory subunit SDS22 n=1 Tax=Golovinomyces cichoracearum TaxID=62708 RepID=A0A420J640_9PEZI|nr:Protein phosphatase 1 regulatory subunit SDS22 [Golovinomyces cichoracearum]
MASTKEMAESYHTTFPTIPTNDANNVDQEKPSSPCSDSELESTVRLEKKIELINPDTSLNLELSNNENVMNGEVIEADEGTYAESLLDILDDYPLDATEIDCVHSRVSSIPSLRLERFKNVIRLCLRQNSITEIEGLSCLANTLTELDLYDNLISHVRHLDKLIHLTSLDLSFNKIKHIKNISHLDSLTDLYFVQNKISHIENISGLTKLRNLELAANRIRNIQGLETLTGLEELWLGKNKITEITGLDTLQRLKILSIQSNRITSITGLTLQTGLEELYISHNALTNLSGLEACSSLRILEISNNKITSLQGLEHLSHLQELWASHNELESFSEVESVLADKKELVTVYFEGNPLQSKGPAVYRNKIKLAIPQVLQIDASK